MGLIWVNPQLCHCEVIQALLPAGKHKTLFGYNEGDFLEKDLTPERGLLLFTQQSCCRVIYTETVSSVEKKNLYLWPRQWHKNKFKPFSICLQSQCNAIITCFHGPGHIWLALPKKKKDRKKKKKIKKITQGAFFPLRLLCVYFALIFGLYFWKRLQQQIKVWDTKEEKTSISGCNLLYI